MLLDVKFKHVRLQRGWSKEWPSHVHVHGTQTICFKLLVARGQECKPLHGPFLDKATVPLAMHVVFPMFRLRTILGAPKVG